MVIPAAANPMMLRTTHPTAAGMDRAVSKRTSFFQRGVMTDYHGIPELLEEYIQPHSGAGLWVTVPEFRTYFGMDERL